MRNYLLLVLFVLPFVIQSCGDDKNGDGKVDKPTKIENFSVAIGTSQYGGGKTYVYSWKGVQDAYSYQVLYRAKGSTGEWATSNIYIPNPNTPGQMMSNAMMASYSKGVVYQVQIVAHRDSRDLIIAESDVIETEALPLQ